VEHRLLAALNEDDRRSVLARMSRRGFRRHDTLFHEGDPGDSLHLIEKGRVAIRMATRDGDVATLAVLGRGDSFGEQALIGPLAARTASAVALEAVETRVLHRNDFAELRRAHPSVERLLVDLLAEQVRRLSAQLIDALYLPVEQRVVRRLADVAALYATDDGLTVEVPLRQEDLASLAGTTRPTTNRVLQQLQDDELVSLQRGRLVVLDLDALERRGR
jgi:CRP-like cAMP-binding protein